MSGVTQGISCFTSELIFTNGCYFCDHFSYFDACTDFKLTVHYFLWCVWCNKPNDNADAESILF